MAETAVGSMVSWGTTWLIVTGASQGLGAGICEGFASQMAPGSIIVGLARSKKGLDETAQKVKQNNSEVQFVGISQDLKTFNIGDLEKILEDSLRLSSRNFQRAILVHNAGSLGKLDYLRTLDDLSYIQEYFDLNVSSVVPLTSLFLRISRSMVSSPQLSIINISSLCAISPTKSWGLYCAAKAGRDMMFKVLAAEEQTLSVLSYAPGPLDNDMQKEAINKTSDPEIKNLFQKTRDENKLVPVKDSVEKLIETLKEGKYVSGDHVDYFD